MYMHVSGTKISLSLPSVNHLTIWRCTYAHRSTFLSRSLLSHNAPVPASRSRMMADRKVTGGDPDAAERSQRTVLLGIAERGGEYGSTGLNNALQRNALGSKTLPTPFRVAETGPFPFGAVLILAICMTLNAYTLVNLFPYVGLMVKGLLRLSTTNEIGE